ncbi:O-antigen ligase family protein [Flavobacterium sp. WC2430]|uniref:O-antigen ligase family protein n=1 Tax=Flavobacterium sp. WC2430 TaxID=3234137 RepID=UPI0034671C0B
METIYAYLKKAFQELMLLHKQSPPLLLLLVVLLTIPLSYAINSIVMGIFGLSTLFYAKKSNFKIDKNLFLLVFLYALMALSLLWSHDLNASIKAISKELPLLIFAVCFMSFPAFDESKKQLLLKYYSFGMFFYVVYFLIKAVIRYSITRDNSVFFYHELVTDDLNAIHVSVYMSVAFFYFYSKEKRSKLNSIIAFLLAIFIFLLSSKNIIVVFVLLLIVFELFYSKGQLKQKKAVVSLFLLAIIMLLFSTKIKERFLIEWNSNKIENTISSTTETVNNISVNQAWTQEKFNQNDYFSGTAFRVYQIRIFKEMLEEDNVFFKGYGLNASDFRIKEKGKEHTIFSGDATHDGYQNKNFHNQYVQIFAETGIVGLLLLLLIVSLSLRNAIKSKDFVAISFAVLMISLFLTESFLSRQRGVVFFTIFFCVFNAKNSPKPITKL